MCKWETLVFKLVNYVEEFENSKKAKKKDIQICPPRINNDFMLSFIPS